MRENDVFRKIFDNNYAIFLKYLTNIVEYGIILDKR